MVLKTGAKTGDGGLDVLPPVLLPIRLGDAVEIDVEEVDRFLEMEEILFCKEDGVVFRVNAALDAD